MDNSPVGGLTFRAPSPTSITKRPHCSPGAPMLLHMDHHQQQQKRNTDELEAAVRHQLRLPAHEGSSSPLGGGSGSSPPRDGPFLRAKRLRTGDVSSPSISNGPIMNNSPSSSSSLALTMGSNSGGWMNEALKSELLRFFSQGRRQNSPESSANSSRLHGSHNQTLFTEEQVVQICERLLREQRQHMERDFQRILNQKLADQYDAFRRFTQDQVHRQMQEKRDDGSYFS